MEELKRAVRQIAYTEAACEIVSSSSSTLSAAQLSLIPVLWSASSLYRFALYLRRYLYRLNILTKHRLPVPVISVGNLTWGGNGKTPMVEFIARSLSHSRISPLILTRGYGGGDEVRMLARQLQGTSARVGVGANRVATASHFLEKYGYVSKPNNVDSEEQHCEKGTQNVSCPARIGAVILDDGMQHLCLGRDLEIVMVNGIMPWGNRQLLPLGPLREPLMSLSRADIVVIHHADLVKDMHIEALESTILEVKKSCPIYYTELAPTHFLSLGDTSSIISLTTICNRIVLCISGIGCADSFIQRMMRMGPRHLDNLEFTDHHLFLPKDIKMVITRLQALESKFAGKPVVVMTEKDYDRDPMVFEHFIPYETLVLCARLRFVERKGSTESGFKELMDQYLWKRLPGVDISSV